MPRINMAARRWTPTNWRRAGLTLLIGAMVILALDPVDDVRGAAAVLARVAEPGSSLANYDRHPIEVLRHQRGTVRGNIYQPTQYTARDKVMVLLHGVHREGADDKRLVALAHAFAEAGHVVFTPEITPLARYEITPQATEMIGEAVMYAHRRFDRKPVVVGISFAGGLALIAATDERYAKHFDSVVSIGGHHDLSRVTRYFLTNSAPAPDGTAFTLKAHEYGALVVVLSEIDQLAPGEGDAVREVLRLWLAEKPDEAFALVAKLKPQTREMLEKMRAGRWEELRLVLLEVLARSEARMRAASPAGRLSQIRVPVYLAHGEADNVIPPTETLWLAQEVPEEFREEVLVTPVLSHVTMGEGEPTTLDRLRLVKFIAEVLHEAE